MTGLALEPTHKITALIPLSEHVDPGYEFGDGYDLDGAIPDATVTFDDEPIAGVFASIADGVVDLVIADPDSRTPIVTIHLNNLVRSVVAQWVTFHDGDGERVRAEMLGVE